jgi:type I restriction enzyme S subunit
MVEWKSIGEIATNVFAGGTPSTKHEEYYDGDIPWIRSGEVDFNVIVSAERNITKAGYDNSSAKLIRKGSVVMAMTGATVAKSAIVDFETSANQSVCAIETDETLANYKYTYYCLAKDYFKIKSSAQGALTSLNLAMIKQIQIPVPSLSVQQRIVEQLDAFTSSIENLKEQIAQRRKQYECYRDQLLDLEGKEEKDIHSWGEFCEMIKGNGVQKVDFVDEGVGCIHYGQIYTHYGSFTYTTNKFVSKEVFEKARKASKGDIIMTDTSENVEDICKSVAYLGENDIAVSNHALIIKHHQNPKFLSYSTLTRSFFNQKRKVVVGVKVSGIKPEHLAQIKIYLPSLDEQQRIVSILDTFEACIANLEAQLAQREKQYEYYRNKLLTF